MKADSNNTNQDFTKINGTYAQVIQSKFKEISQWTDDKNVDRDEYVERISTLVKNEAKSTPKQNKFLLDLNRKGTKTECAYLVYNAYMFALWFRCLKKITNKSAINQLYETLLIRVIKNIT